MKKNLKKLQLHRETLKNLDQVRGGADRNGGFDGTHYESICKDLCQDETSAC